MCYSRGIRGGGGGGGGGEVDERTQFCDAVLTLDKNFLARIEYKRYELNYIYDDTLMQCWYCGL